MNILPIRLIVAALLTVISTATYAEVTATQKGYFEVYCGTSTEYVSRHTQYHKALQKAINEAMSQGTDCRIEQPDVVVAAALPPCVCDDPVITPPDTGSGTGEDPNEPALSSLELSWAYPEEREDGTALSVAEIDHYNIYMGTNKQNLSSVSTPTGSDRTVILELGQGTYYFAISTVDTTGEEGKRSEILEITL